MTSSPHHHQSNGKVESSVKRAKRLLRDTKLSGEDQYMALLNVRNTPTQGADTSPAQRFLGRRTQTTLPTNSKLLRPKLQTAVENKQLQAMKDRQAGYYNRHAHDLPSLDRGDVVRIKPFQLGNKTWKKGTVLQRAGSRSYDVATEDGGVYRRNRVHLRRTVESPPVIIEEDNNAHKSVRRDPVSPQVPDHQDTPSQGHDPKTPRKCASVPKSPTPVQEPSVTIPQSPAPVNLQAQDTSAGYRTRSGRAVKPVLHGDYVYN